MFQKLPLVEIAIELYKGLLTINLVLPPGIIDSGKTVGIHGFTGTTASCPSPAISSSTHGEEHDPWPLRTPSPSNSMASQDSRHGANFSTPPMASEYYVGVDGLHGHNPSIDQANVQGKAQLGTDSSSTTQVVHDDRRGDSVDMDYEAVAPAFKAPRAQ
jgi:hypothetical protein